MADEKNKFLLLSIILLSLSSIILCAEDTITFNKRGCLFIDRIEENQNIISFDYNEGYYRAIHSNYGYWVTDAVKMKFLGDSSKDIFMKCYIGADEEYRTNISPTLLHFYIPCTVEKDSILNEGTYCIEIVKTLIGDINSANFCSDSLTFEVQKSNSVPILNITGFSNDQIGCVKPLGIVTLSANVSNQISKYQDFSKIGIGLSNTEEVIDDIPLDCKIEGQKKVGTNDTITCEIPYSVKQGYYSIFYSPDFVESFDCPANIINKFNSLNFNDTIKKLQIFDGNYQNMETSLINITFENSSKTPGLFNLTFSIDFLITYDYVSFDNFTNKDIKIKLCDKNGELIDTTCNFIKSDNFNYIFYLICIPKSLEKYKSYSLVITENIVIGSVQNQVLCIYEGNQIYKSIVIPAVEYDFLVAFDEDNSPYFDCNLNENGYYLNKISRFRDFCYYCGHNCTTCKGSDFCTKCYGGFSLDVSNKCVPTKDKIDFDKFRDIEEFIPHNNLCWDSLPWNQFFCLKVNYTINEGENYSIKSEQYNDEIFALSDSTSYSLNCNIDVNPSYDWNFKPQFGSCKEIKYVSNTISAAYENEVIKVTNIGYIEDPYIIYVCPEINSEYSDCHRILSCKEFSHDPIFEESIYRCQKRIDCKETKCKTFKSIMTYSHCGEKIYGSFEYEYCPNNYNYSSRSLRNLSILLILLFMF